MTTADLLAAGFHFRPSNILVAPLDATGVYPRGDLIVYRACTKAEFFGRNTLFALGPQEHDLVPDLDTLVHPEDAGVHRNPPQEPAPLATDQDLSPPRERPPIPLRIPHGHGRRVHRRLCPESQPVGYPVPTRELAQAGDVALENHSGPQALRRRISLVASRVQTVERHTGTDAAVVRAGVPEGGGGVRRVHQSTAEGLRGENRVEAFDLAPSHPLVGVGRGEVRIDAG